MKLPEDMRQLLVRRFKSNHRKWLTDKSNAGWPLEISLGIPTAEKAQQQPEGVRAWVAAWQGWQGAGRVDWCDRHWQTFGKQQLPHKLILQQPLDVALWAGESARWQRAIQRREILLARWPMLRTALASHFNLLADYRDTDFNRLLAVLEWIIQHPNSNLYPRQLPIAGIDSKWLEQRKGLITSLLTAIRQDEASPADFFQCCGLKAPPQLIRMRVLDAAIRSQLGGLADITAPLEQLAALTIAPKRVLIVENLQTGLAFDDMPDTVVFMKLGYHVSALAQISWVSNAQCFYWGDLDTHGFAILNQIRNSIPSIRSFLMDEETLLSHRELWVEEEQPHAAAVLPLLTDEEQAVYRGLKQHAWGQNVRLEQERIAWDYVISCLFTLDDGSRSLHNPL